MIDRVRILSARRAYEFGVDDIRLTMLSSTDVRERIRAAFGFAVVTIAPPPEVFGPVSATQPPGLIFQTGEAVIDGQTIPIRGIFIDAIRIVIDVASPSSHIDTVYALLQDQTAGLVAPDGSPVLGQSVQTLEQSEMAAHMIFDLEKMLMPSVATFLRGKILSDSPSVLVPSIEVQSVGSNDPYQGSSTAGGASFILQMRVGSRPADRVLYSLAPLNTDAHQDYLAGLAVALTSRKHTRKRL